MTFPSERARARHVAGAVVVIVVAVLAALIAGATGAAPAAGAAPLSQTTVITWNMQGGTTGGESKWTYGVDELARDAPVVLLQEAGAGPPERRDAQGVERVRRAPADVAQYRWTGNSGTTYYVYWLHTGGGGNQVNSAIVTRGRPAEITVRDNPADGRRVLGVRIGNDWYFTYHGLSSPANGRDAPGVIRDLDAAYPTGNWALGGDFNLEPEHLSYAPLRNPHIYRPHQATQLTGLRELDYMVAGRDRGDITTTARRGIGSDHLPVQIGAVQAAGPPPTLPAADNDPPLIEPMGPAAWGYGYLLSDKLGVISGYGPRPIPKRGGATVGAIDDPPGSFLGDLTKRYAKPVTTAPQQAVVYTLMDGTHDLIDPAGADAAAGDGKRAVDDPAGVTAARLNALVDTVLRAQPNATVAIGLLPPSRNPAPGLAKNITTVNAAVAAAGAVAAGAKNKHLVLAATNSLSLDDVAPAGNAIALTPTGDQKVAQAFVDAVNRARDKGWLFDPDDIPRPGDGYRPVPPGRAADSVPK